MKNIPDSAEVENYLQDLEGAYQSVERTYQECAAGAATAKADYQNKADYYAKIKAYWEKIQHTDEQASEVKQMLDLAVAAFEKLESIVESDLEAVQYLVCDVVKMSEKLEGYKGCVEKLNIQIEGIKATGFDKGSAIPMALKALHAAYEEAIKCALTALEEILNLLQSIGLLQVHVEANLKWQINCSLTDDPSGSNTGASFSCDDIVKPNIASSDSNYTAHEKVRDSLKDYVDDLLNQWTAIFPMDGKCGYYDNLKREEERAKRVRDDAKVAYSEYEKVKNKAQAKLGSIKPSLEAAKAAKAC